MIFDDNYFFSQIKRCQDSQFLVLVSPLWEVLTNASSQSWRSMEMRKIFSGPTSDKNLLSMSMASLTLQETPKSKDFLKTKMTAFGYIFLSRKYLRQISILGTNEKKWRHYSSDKIRRAKSLFFEYFYWILINGILQKRIPKWWIPSVGSFYFYRVLLLYQLWKYKNKTVKIRRANRSLGCTIFELFFATGHWSKFKRVFKKWCIPTKRGSAIWNI